MEHVFLAYDNNFGGYQFIREFQWLDSLGITFSLGVDGISVPMVLLTGIVMFTGVLISWNIEYRTKDFFMMFFLLVAGVFGVFVSLDLFFFFFFYELAVLPMYLLIGVWGSSSDFGTFLRPKEYGARTTVLSPNPWPPIIPIQKMARLPSQGNTLIPTYLPPSRPWRWSPKS